MPQDNNTLYERVARGQNIAANGRLGSLGMAAIALHQDRIFFAFLFVLLVLAAYLAEQLDYPARVWAALMIAAWGVILVAVFAASLLWW